MCLNEPAGTVTAALGRAIYVMVHDLHHTLVTAYHLSSGYSCCWERHVQRCKCPLPPVSACLQELSRRLLAEQNAEYEASLAADREREARRQEEARKAEAEAQQRAAEEARVR